eukprot:CAMPEP_0194445614 /NCGR_PEP_ID=MMETSP0176-20130528/127966_1 /TAXON_ID=216777 /ORGANISM="Proboscia alata, Strain PI-D3" /LENGTH=51 /DNA_ID=CAMNT_0039272205 /DNA_START=629 /DNA_END=781 /DNA_ORIENTATION=+
MGDGITHAEVGGVFFELLKDNVEADNGADGDGMEVTELAPCGFREDDLRER